MHCFERWKVALLRPGAIDWDQREGLRSKRVRSRCSRMLFYKSLDAELQHQPEYMEYVRYTVKTFELFIILVAFPDGNRFHRGA